MKKNKSFSELMQYAGNHKILTYLSCILSAVSNLLALLPFVFIFFIIREVIEVDGDYSLATHIVKNGWLAVLFSLLTMLIYFAALMCSHLSAFRIAGNMKKQTMLHISKLPMGYLEEMGSGKIRRIVNDSSNATETYLAHQLPDMAGAIITPVGMIVLLFLFDWRLGLVSLLPTILSFCVMMKMAGPGMAEDMKQYQSALEDMNNEAVEYIRGIPVVKAFNQSVFSFKRFKGSIDRYNHFCVSYTKKLRGPMIAYTTLINSVFVFLITLILLLYHQEDLSVYLLNLLFYIIFTPIISSTLTKVMYMSENKMIVEDALNRIHQLTDLKVLDYQMTDEILKDYSVSFDHVSFCYNKDENYALSDVSFTIEDGKTIALVGPSGGGKTTIATLLSRFYDIEDGTIAIGGVNIKHISKKKLSELISYVFQDSKLLKTTILENVRLGKEEATEEEVLKALQLAQCDDIIRKLPDGIHSMIGSQGVYLSGGEQQRIAIARMILKDAPIVILDEATAFADPENEYLVQKALEKLCENKTVIMIAHRLSTIQKVDEIYVLKEGKIIEHGNHEQLLQRNGIYLKMWKDYQSAITWRVGGSV